MQMSIAKCFGAWRLNFVNSWKTEKWIQYLPRNEANSNSIRYSSNTGVMVTYNYPIISLNVDTSTLVNKVLYHFDTATFSCQVQGSHLMEKRKPQKVKNSIKKNLVSKLLTKHLQNIFFHCTIFFSGYSITVIIYSLHVNKLFESVGILYIYSSILEND